MVDTKLAIEKSSPIAWWSVLFTNFAVSFGFLLAVGGVALAYWTLDNDKGTPGLIFGALAVGFGGRLFLGSLMSSATIRKVRYTGTVEVRKSPTSWIVNLPAWAFKNRIEGFTLSLIFAKALETTPLEETEESVLVFVIGVDEDDSKEFRVKLVHKCDDDGKCNKPQIHLFGYKEDRDGALAWPTM